MEIEEHLVPLLESINKILDPDLRFVLLSCHSPGYTPTSLANLLVDTVGARADQIQPGEMLIEHSKPLPSGTYAYYVKS